jgi:hypothetical protein
MTVGGSWSRAALPLPSGPYGVELRGGADVGADYEYWFITERFDPQ